MGFYDNLQATAERLINDKGGNVTMEIVTPGTFDRETGNRPQTTAQVTVKAVLLEAKQKWLAGTLVKVGDKQALVAGTVTNTPKVGYYLITSTERYYIDEVEPLIPDDATPLLYALTLKIGGQASETFEIFGAT